MRCKTPHRQCRTPIVTRYGPKRCPLAHTAGYGGSDQRPSGLRRNGIPPTTTFSTPAWSASGTDAPDPPLLPFIRAILPHDWVALATRPAVPFPYRFYPVDPKDLTMPTASPGGTKADTTTADASVAERVLPVVGANIVARREQLGMSQRRLAENADVDRAFLRTVERGERTPTLVFLARLAGALNTTVHKLTRGV